MNEKCENPQCARAGTTEPWTAEQQKVFIDAKIVESKQFRVALDGVLETIKISNRSSRERSLCVTKLQEAIMWLGMDLKALGDTNPYPNSYNPENTVVEPTADGLKM